MINEDKLEKDIRKLISETFNDTQMARELINALYDKETNIVAKKFKEEMIDASLILNSMTQIKLINITETIICAILFGMHCAIKVKNKLD